MKDLSKYFDRDAFPRVKEYQAVPDGEYRSLAGINASILKEHTPAEMWHQMNLPEEDHYGTEARAHAFTLGTLAHAVVLEPWKFSEADKYFLESPTKGIATKAAQELRGANPGKLLVTPELLDQARLLMLALAANPTARKYISAEAWPHAQREAVGHCFDPTFSVWRKMRCDFIPKKDGKLGNFIADVKTTRRGLDEFESEAWRLGYYLQAAWYLDTAELLTGIRPEFFVWLVVTTEEPFMSRIFYQRHLRRKDPLYEQSKLRMARERLGLDPSERIGRLAMWTNSAREHEAARLRGATEASREIWIGYEQETPEREIL